MRRMLACIIALAAARETLACTMRQFDPNEVLRNETYASPNGRYVAVYRYYEGVPDFGTELAGNVRRPQEPSLTRTVALYEMSSRGRRLRREIETDPRDVDGVLVADDGITVVTVRQPGSLYAMCGGRKDAANPLLAIYSGGERLRLLTLREVLTDYDIRKVEHIDFLLRRENDTRDVLVMKIPAGDDRQSVERRVDVATGELIDPVEAIYPIPKVVVTALQETSRELQPAPRQCASQWDDANVARVDDLLELAQRQAIPPVPEIMIRANVRGSVVIDVLVSEEGKVLCTRASQLPFAGDVAVDAARQWTFRPMVVEGRAVKFAGKLQFSFNDVKE